MTDTTEFPMIMGLNGKTFEWVFNNKSEWVDFCLTEMKDATGVFKCFQDYCKKKNKDNKYAKDRDFQIVNKIQTS